MRFKIIYSNPKRYYIDGIEVSAEEYEAASPHRLVEALKAARTAQSQTTTCWPMKSDALSCHPSQVKEITERNKRHGITGITYEADGTCIMSDRGARRDLMALEGKFDKNGGYGDDHANESPLYRQDEVPFCDEILKERSVYFDRDGRPIREVR